MPGRLKDLRVDRISFVSRGAARDPGDPTDTQRHLLWKREDVERAAMSTADINDLPDSAFAYIEPGGKVEGGKTMPRSLRHYPVHDKAHADNARARAEQATAKGGDAAAIARKALPRIRAAQAKFGEDVSKASSAWDALPEDVKGAIAELAEFADDNGATNDDDDTNETTTKHEDTAATDVAPSSQTAAESAAPRGAIMADPKDTDTSKGEGAEQTAIPGTAKTEEPVEKGDRVSLTKAEHDALIARIAKSEADAAEAAQVAKAERDKRVDAEFLAKAEALPYLPGKFADNARVFRQMAEAAPEAWGVIEPMLTQLNETVAKSAAFRVIGRGAGTEDGSAQGQLAAKAAEIRKSEPALNIGEAYDRAMKANPELAQRAINEPLAS